MPPQFAIVRGNGDGLPRCFIADAFDIHANATELAYFLFHAFT